MLFTTKFGAQKTKHKSTTTAMVKNDNLYSRACQTEASYYARSGSRQKCNKQVCNAESEMSEEEENPPTIIQTYTSASCSLTSSIDIGEFGMITAKKGNETAFCIAVKEQRF